MLDILEVLGISKIDKDKVFTPNNIAKDIVYQVPEDDITLDIKILDIACKTGIFLRYWCERLMNNTLFISEYKEEKERYLYITNKCLYGIALDDMTKIISERNVNGELGKCNNIITIPLYNERVRNNHIEIQKALKEAFNIMKFDIVIGNPPYNRGADIDFVHLGFQLSKKYVCMITPAKWQTAEADQKIASTMSYGQFRELIVPHMKYVCFYPNCTDLFEIAQIDGISWYIIDKLNKGGGAMHCRKQM